MRCLRTENPGKGLIPTTLVAYQLDGTTALPRAQDRVQCGPGINLVSF